MDRPNGKQYLASINANLMTELANLLDELAVSNARVAELEKPEEIDRKADGYIDRKLPAGIIRESA